MSSAFRGLLLKDGCSCENCCACGECCLACAETCNCCNTTSVESCLDACCPKRGNVDFADIITCEACCSGQCCEVSRLFCGGTACICAPTDVSNVNCLCCAFEQERPRPDTNE
ncbi:unnamed protein product [Didymodactylos carnosus]|uniref:Metallothionein n=1 Tax=Didymodactylos carnosus TaxID=1234261 RepID=A0A813V0K3_9BILA|nr:unnamed protein product [Didymodactylos carnosus]CAF0975275.1 unnamed protein product [Didymodactylos carnosus]CAF3625203.1 unnamed protein product [Didymodactylos carnosus]CAF3745992.1 unnamed protein product [Didymodactylos carnosus]